MCPMGPSVPQGGGVGSGRPDPGPQRGRAGCLRPRRRGEQSPDGPELRCVALSFRGLGSESAPLLAGICRQVVPGGGVWSPESLLRSMCRGGCGRLSARRCRTPMPGCAERAAGAPSISRLPGSQSLCVCGPRGRMWSLQSWGGCVSCHRAWAGVGKEVERWLGPVLS